MDYIYVTVNSRTLEGGENNSLSEKPPNEIAIDWLLANIKWEVFYGKKL